ncbi:MAG: hypothetical protein QOF18_260 [Frankiaceae bacterium]|jgi:hypothetical protein|nr:hypothetical protein [Frankiaceae bacterium]
MSLSMTSRRADAFADLLERGASTDDPVVGPFLALAGALRAVPAAAGPSPEFRAALRQRVLAVATVQGVGEPAASTADRLREAGATWKVQRRVAVLAGGAAAVTAIAGVGIGASRSLPGDPFYGVKRATERVQLATTEGREAKGKRHLEFARTRLAEVEALATGSSALPAGLVPGTPGASGPLTEAAKTSSILATLRDMDAQTRAGANDLYAVHLDTGSQEPLRALDSFTQAQFTRLRAVLPTLPQQAQLRAQSSLSLLDVVARHTVALAGSPATPGTGPGPTGTPGATGTPGTGSKSPRPHGSGSATPPPGGGSTTPAGQPSLPGGPPTPVPTIPALPTTLPVPTTLPTELPTLPPGLPGLGGLGG